MKVKELIQKLSIFDPEMRVVLDGYECGYDEVEKIRMIRITPNPSPKDWEGEFDFVIVDDERRYEQVELALYLPRKS